MKPLVTDDNNSYFSRHFLLIVLAVALLGLVLRLPTLESRSLWLDETYSAWFSAVSFSDLWFSVPLYETHPPMFYFCLKVWASVFGNSEPALRSMSVVFSVGTIVTVALYGRILQGGDTAQRVSLVAALFLCVNQANIEYAQQARPYAMETFFVVATVLCSLLLLKQLRNNADASAPRYDLKTICSLGILAGITLWTHNTAVFIMAAVWLGMGVVTIAFIPGNRLRQGFVLVLPGLLALAIWAPFLPMLLQQNANMGQMQYWIPFKPNDVVNVWKFLAGGDKFQLLPLLLLFVIGLIVLWRRNRPALVHVLLILAFPLSAIFLYSYLVKPMFIMRLFLWMGPLFLMVAAAGIVIGIRHRSAQFAACLIVVASCGYSSYNFYKAPTEDWREVFNTLSMQAKKDDIVLLLPNEIDMPLKYYGDRHTTLPKTVSLPASYPALGMSRPYVSNLAAPLIIPSDDVLVRNTVSSHARVWLITRKSNLYDRGEVVRSVLNDGRKNTVFYDLRGIRVEAFDLR